MLDEATYQTPDGKSHSLFQEPPVYSINPTEIEKEVSVEKYGEIKIKSQSSDTDMIFQANVEVSEKCTTCLVILRQTYHPSWVATVDGKRAETILVFPFYTAIKVSPGTHDIVFSYEPSLLKNFVPHLYWKYEYPHIYTHLTQVCPFDRLRILSVSNDNFLSEKAG